MEKAVTRARDHRYERKFLVSELTKNEIESLIKLHPAMFSEIYQQRFVNNLYFDSPHMKHYWAAVDGLKERVKVRIRWYDDLFGPIEKPVLELKIKDGLTGRKEQFPLIPFVLDDSFQLDRVVGVLKGSELPDDLKLDLLALEVCLLNRYKRRYFESADRKYRITVDSEMEFYQVKRYDNPFLHKSVDFVNTVLELKYDLQEDQYASRISNFFPFRMTKSSKYVNGVEGLYV